MALTTLLVLGLTLLSASATTSTADRPAWQNVSWSVAYPYNPVSQSRQGLSPLSPLYGAPEDSLDAGGRPPGCPPCPECFNCQLPRFECKQYGQCGEFDGQCKCPEGFGGQDCGEPLCDSLADGDRRHPRPQNATACQCAEGWSGVNCNVCQTDRACRPLVSGEDPKARRSQMTSTFEGDDDEEQIGGAICFKGGYTVKRSYQMCDVTNRKILDMLPDRPPQVSFSCDASSATCQFQFWIGGVESFYCALDDCAQSIDVGPEGKNNVTKAVCDTMKCKCVPGKMLCGESGSVDIGDFLREEIKGPGKFSCSTDGSGCRFEEDAMNGLISDVFGDTYITLRCDAGECMHYTQVPGFSVPQAPDNSRLVALSIALAGLIVVAASLLFWYLGRAHKSNGYAGGRIRLPTEEAATLMAEHVPATLHFSNVSYTIGGKKVLDNISGALKPGQVMAIMGASGAGKSTFLDILARKSKRGNVEGKILVNGAELSDGQYRRLIGFVDQEDTLMGTLTVYETVLYSAMLRLPREMSVEAKKIRTLETMEELGILGIRGSRIGEAGRRSISGGEKRRVSIACELVTSPSILFLDEPTSGLDAFNAINVVESLVALARNYRRTVVFTIHQPRSNIVALFDQLVLLARGKLVYGGPAPACQTYFESVGYPCPAGFNIADFLVDLTMQDNGSSSEAPPSRDEVEAQAPRGRVNNESEGGTELRSRGSSPRRVGSLRSWASRTFGSTKAQDGEVEISERVSTLVRAFAASEINATTQNEIRSASQIRGSVNGGTGDGGGASFGGYRKASLWTQFTILSGRAFRNLYRNPMLMLAHYLLAIVLALICAGLFHGVTLDIGGFQGRMGLFFFVLALFGFSSLTSIGVFSSERILFMRERSNGYYSPVTYFASKVLFDVIPLRVVPPFILGAIIYRPVGLVPTVEQFWQFLLILITFNLVASSVVLLISIVIADTGIANLVGSLVMLFNLLFAGLLINREKLPRGTGWLQDASFFHAAFEALLINEVRYLTLKDHRYGVDIEVPSASILSLFGFRTTAYWWPDYAILVMMFAGLTLLSCLALVAFVRERR